jgi:hypothetical protein
MSSGFGNGNVVGADASTDGIGRAIVAFVITPAVDTDVFA